MASQRSLPQAHPSRKLFLARSTPSSASPSVRFSLRASLLACETRLSVKAKRAPSLGPETPDRQSLSMKSILLADTTKVSQLRTAKARVLSVLKAFPSTLTLATWFLTASRLMELIRQLLTVSAEMPDSTALSDTEVTVQLSRVSLST